MFGGPMHMGLMPGTKDARSTFVPSFLLLLTLLCGTAAAAYADNEGKIAGTVKDPSGAFVPNAQVNLTNDATHQNESAVTDSTGLYSFPVVPIGTYSIKVTANGFKALQKNSVTVTIRSTLAEDFTLQIGGEAETVEVNASAVQVETADTELGETLESQKITAVPLNGRSYTDLLSTQSGVTPITTSAAQSGSSGGSFASAIAPSGGLDPGQFSISGQRESANGFMLNGADVVEAIASAAGVIPNLDSIAEYRILTTNSDAEFGNYSGGLVSVVTKSGTDTFHGSVFEFLRNTQLDAIGYFDSARPTYIQNQFGGTFGGPVRKDKVFFFGDYQGTRNVQGIETPQIPVPSLQDRSGNLSDIAAFNGTVTDGYFAGLLSKTLGRPIAVGTEQYYYPGCTAASNPPCVFPGGQIPRSVWSAPAKYLLQYIPSPTTTCDGQPCFQTDAYKENLNDDKGSLRLDANTRYGNLSVYYFLDGYNVDNPYAVAQGGANLPGFSALSNGKAQLLALSDTKPLGTKTVVEGRISYLRNANDLGQPQGGLDVSPSEEGFVSAAQGGFLPQSPTQEGVASVNFNNYTIGSSPYTLSQVNNTYQASGAVSRTVSFEKTEASYMALLQLAAAPICWRQTVVIYG